MAKAIEQYADYIRAETLTEKLESGATEDGFFTGEFALDGETLSLGVRRVE